MTRLGVNIDHIATLRQARGTSYPDPVEGAQACIDAGAGGITAHLREDRRHIQDRDVRRLASECTVPFNLEMASAPDVVALAVEIQPQEVCLVPEKRQELTTEGGLDVVRERDALRPLIADFSKQETEVSLFIDPDEDQIRCAVDLGALTIELHTGTFCDTASSAELDRLIQGAELAASLGLNVNAGHGIHLGNIGEILRIPHLDTLNIGHSIVSDAVMVGMKEATRRMLAAIERGAS